MIVARSAASVSSTGIIDFGWGAIDMEAMIITRMRGRRFGAWMLTACFLYTALLTAPRLSSAQDDLHATWKVREKLRGEPKDSLGLDSKKSEDVSGVGCAATTGFPRVCLLADDETQGAQVVILKEGELVAGDFIRLIDDAHDGRLLALDAEGVAYADGSFYVIGSHGMPRHEHARDETNNKARTDATRRVFRIRFAPDGVDPRTGKIIAAPDIQTSSELARLIKAQAELAPWLDGALSDNGLTIEGVAVRDGRLYVGMRGPVLADESAVILELPLAMVFDGEAGNATLHRVSLGKDTLGKPRGLRDLVVFGDAFLLLAGPVREAPPGLDVKTGDYAVFRWNKTSARKLLDLKGYGKGVKPEALLPLDETGGQLRALLFFDGSQEGAARLVQIDVR
jgi:hypothetical protein